MPWTENQQPIAAPVGSIPQQPEPDVPTSDVIRAAFRSQNTVGSWLSSPSLSGWREPDFDPLAEILDTPYAQHASAFVDVRNRDDMGKVMRRLDQEQADSETLAQAGGEAVLWQVVGGVLDPVNLIPVGGEVAAAYRAGRIARGIAGGARAGLIGAAASEAALQATQYTRTPLEAFENLAGSAVLGGVFGGAGAAVGKLIGSGKLRTTARSADEAGANLREEISAAIRGVEANPKGDPFDPLVELHSEDIGKVILARGGFKNINEMEVSKGGWGLVKIIWRHGWKSGESPEFRVREEDVLALPEIVRDITPDVQPDMGPGSARWVVESGERRVVYAVNEFADGRAGDARVVVSVYVADPKRGDFPALSARKSSAGGPAASPGEAYYPPEDTAASSAQPEMQGRAEPPAPLNIAFPEPGVTPDQSSVGAARVVSNGLEAEGLKSALGIEKALKFQDPVLRMLNSASVEARRAVQELAEIPMTLRKNAQGIATGVEGGAVETRTKAWMGDDYAFERALGSAFVEYRLGRAQKFGDLARLNAADMLRRGDAGPMTFAQFRERVARASRRGDVDPLGDAHVTKAAKAYRELDEKIKREAISVGLWKEEPDVGDTAVSHVTRVYDKERIKAQRPEFVRRVASWLVRQAEGPDNLPVPEAMDMAEQVTDKVLGTPDGRLPYDIDLEEMARALKTKLRPTESGLFRERTLKIPDREIEEFLENDVAVIARRQIRSMAPDIELARTFGDVAGTLREKQIAEDFNRLIAGAKSETDRTALGRSKDAALRDFAAMRDILRGTYAMPDDPDAWTVRAARAARQLNAVRLLGGMTISAFSDVARPVMVHGLGRVFGDGIAPMVRNFGAFRAAGEELKLMGVGLDMVNNSRQGMIADIMDDYGRHTRFERGLQGLANANGLLTLMAPWNASMKQFSGVITMTRILEACEAAAAGRIAPKELERLAAAGISRDTAEQIAAQFAKYGGDVDGVRIANTTAWDAPRSVVDAFKSAVIREVDKTVVTPGIGDRPLWMSSETGKLLGQFKSFGFASVQRTLISGLQDRDAAALSGAMLMVGLGMLSYAVKAKLAGRDVADADDYVTWLGEGLDRSGLIGWIMDAYNVPAQAWGAQTSRYASRSVVESLGGPTFGGGLDLASRVAVDAGRGEFDQGTVHALRRLAPYQNLIGLSKAFDAAEQGFNETFGVPAR